MGAVHWTIVDASASSSTPAWAHRLCLRQKTFPPALRHPGASNPEQYPIPLPVRGPNPEGPVHLRWHISSTFFVFYRRLLCRYTALTIKFL
jgi:hypothetical protein